MKVYALVGKSGTGKSYQAINLCKEMNISSIIDDGLFIYENKVMAGVSAKREATKIGAIKTALFTKDEQRDKVVSSIKRADPDSILVIATSDGMAEKIRERLDLPEFKKTIYIEEITTESERALAYKQRYGKGTHVIPAPTFQLKRQFSGYFVDPMRIIRGWGAGKSNLDEKSVVRPTYSYRGDYTISEKVLTDIISYSASQLSAVSDVSKVIVNRTENGIEVQMSVCMCRGCNIVEGAKNLQRRCTEIIEEMTAFNVDAMNVNIGMLE